MSGRSRLQATEEEGRLVQTEDVWKIAGYIGVSLVQTEDVWKIAGYIQSSKSGSDKKCLE